MPKPAGRTLRIVRRANIAVIRCRLDDCESAREYEAIYPPGHKRYPDPRDVTLAMARVWAYEDGWRSVAGYGWLCPTHAPLALHLRGSRVFNAVRAPEIDDGEENDVG